MIKQDLAFKLWDLSNLTVGFSVAQAMAFFYMAAEGKLEKLFNNTFAVWFTFLICLAGCFIYLAILWGCKKGAQELLSSDKASFKLTKQSYEKLRMDGLPEYLLTYLRSLENQSYTGKNNFVEAIEKAIASEQSVKYKSAILKSASDNNWQDVEKVWLASTRIRYYIIILFTLLSLILYIYLIFKYQTSSLFEQETLSC